MKSEETKKIILLLKCTLVLSLILKGKSLWQTMINKVFITIIYCSPGNSTFACTAKTPKILEFWNTGKEPNTSPEEVGYLGIKTKN